MTLRHALAHWLGWNGVKLDCVNGLVVCQGCQWVEPMEQHRLPTFEPIPAPKEVEKIVYVASDYTPYRVVRHEHVYRDPDYDPDDDGPGGLWSR
jgi:hypothetical protein